MKKSLILTNAMLVVLVSGCATTSPLVDYYKPSDPNLLQKKIPISEVKITETPAIPESTLKQIKNLVNQGYIMLGVAQFTSPQLTPKMIREFASGVGSDMIVMHAPIYLKNERDSRMVLGSYTPATTSYSTANAYAVASGNANTYGRTPFGPFNYNTTSSAQAFGTGTSTTYNPAQMTFVRQEFEVPIFYNSLAVLQSPQAQNRNWENYQKLMGYDKQGFVLDIQRFNAEKNKNAIPIGIRRLGEEINRGRNFSPIEAQQFVHRENYKQLYAEANLGR